MTIENSKRGKKARANGADFERRTRADLESKGFVCSKWQNNLDYPEENINLPPEERKDFKCVPAKNKFNPFSKAMMLGGGFPDFFAYRLKDSGIVTQNRYIQMAEIIFVECKVNGYLDKIEKEKAKWYLENNYCNKFLVASKSKIKNKVVINYKEIS